MEPLKIKRKTGEEIELSEFELQLAYDYYRRENIREFLTENYSIPSNLEDVLVDDVLDFLSKDYDEESAINEALKKNGLMD